MLLKMSMLLYEFSYICVYEIIIRVISILIYFYALKITITQKEVTPNV